MLRVEESARQRFALLGGIVIVFLGGLIVSGLIQRFSGSMGTESHLPDAKELGALRLEAKRRREMRAEAAVLAKTERWKDVLALLQKQDQSQTNATYLQAEAKLRAGHFEDAKKDMLSYLPSTDPISMATRLILAGEQDAYQKLCADIIKSVPVDRASATDINNAAWLVALGPNGVSDYTMTLKLAQKGVDGAAPEDKANFLNTLGALQFRAKMPNDAIKTLQEADKRRKDAFNWVFLAMAFHDKGDEQQAKQYLSKARTYLNNSFASPPDLNRHELLLFFHEADQYVGNATTVVAR